MKLVEKVCRASLHAAAIHAQRAEPGLLAIRDLERFPAMVERKFVGAFTEGAVHDNPMGLGKSVHRILHACGKAHGVKRVLRHGARPSRLA